MGRQRNWLAWIMLTPQGLQLRKRRSMPSSTWIDLAMPRTVHVHWLHKLLLYMSQSRAHIPQSLMDQSGLTTCFMDRQNAESICTMHLLITELVQTIIKWFSIHTNTSDFQLGVCIIQEGRPVAYCTRPLGLPQVDTQGWRSVPSWGYKYYNCS
jgi:hypothetical protein